MNQGEFLQIGMWYKELYERNPAEATKVAWECQIYTANELHCTLKEVKDVVDSATPQISPQNIKIALCYWNRMDSYSPKSTN